MISEGVMRDADALRASFQRAKPFKHLCIDGFLDEPRAEALLRDFPRFDREKARNEFGEYGRKAVQPRLAEISPAYAEVYHYLLSREFLDAMERITGISDLISDPTMFGGGTHDNLDGQELDPHIDFNYTQVGDAHRRVNLLVYLNKGWREDWGGQIELHSDPREPDANVISAFNVTFNRAVLFETNEISWHGFPRIRLPPDQAGNSRKCLSVYLYTKTRPAEEIAGKHATFYVQRPLGSQFVAGHTLTEADAYEARAGFRSRDTWIASYQKMEERLSREIDASATTIRELSSQVSEQRAVGGVPVAGYALMQRVTSGARYPDGWATATLALDMEALRSLSRAEVTVIIVEQMPRTSRVFTLEVGPYRSEHVIESIGMTTITLPVAIEAGSRFALTVTCSADFRLSALGLGEDERDLAYLLRLIVLD